MASSHHQYMSREDELLQQINDIRDNYYQENGKNVFFKNGQKREIAEKVCQTIDYNDLIHKAIFVVPNTNKIFFDYPLFKTFATPENIGACQVYLQHTLLPFILQCYDHFEMHVNLSTFSVSACQRFFNAIKSLFNSTTELAKQMDSLYIYYTPHVIEQIRTMLYPVVKHILPKIVYYSKIESETKIKQL